MPRATVKQLTYPALVKLFPVPRTAFVRSFQQLNTLAARAQHEIQHQHEASSEKRMLRHINQLCQGSVKHTLEGLATAHLRYVCLVGRKLRGVGTVWVHVNSYEVESLCSAHARCGSKMMKHIERSAAASGRSLVFVKAVRQAVGFYRKMGYAAVDVHRPSKLALMVKAVGKKGGQVPTGPTLSQDFLYPQQPELRAPDGQQSVLPLHELQAALKAGKTKISFSNMTFTLDQLKSVAGLLAANPVTMVGFERCQLEDAAVPPLAALLASSTTLHRLNLAHNHLTEAGAELLAQAIEVNATPGQLHVDVDNNPLPASGMERIEQALQRHARKRIAEGPT